MAAFRFVAGVLVVAVVHFWGTYMLQFMKGTTQSGNRPLAVVATVLTFPLSLMKGSDDTPPWLGWGAWGALSLVWGTLVCAVGRAIFPASGK